VVFKECQVDEGRRAWENEIDTLIMMGDKKYVVQYLGSFEQNGKLVIILEYANGGSLLDVFMKDQQPRNADQVTKFWENLVDLLIPLHYLHHTHQGVGLRVLPPPLATLRRALAIRRPTNVHKVPIAISSLPTSSCSAMRVGAPSICV